MVDHLQSPDLVDRLCHRCRLRMIVTDWALIVARIHCFVWTLVRADLSLDLGQDSLKVMVTVLLMMMKMMPLRRMMTVPMLRTIVIENWSLIENALTMMTLNSEESFVSMIRSLLKEFVT